MSQDLQLAYNRTPSTQIEPWNTGGNTALGAPAGPQANPLQRIHRSLRGRYILAVVLALLGGMAGGTAGYLTGEPGYVSKGAIQVRPNTVNTDRTDSMMQMYDRHMASQAALLQSDKVLKFAVEHPLWKATNPPPTPNPMAMFALGLKAEFLKNTEIIQVSYTHKDPAAAQAAVKAVIQSYDKHCASEESKDLDTRINYWKTMRFEATGKIAAAYKRIKELNARYGTTDLEILSDARWREYTELNRQFQRVKADLAAMEIAGGPDASDMAVEDIALADPQMFNHLRIRDQIAFELESAKARLGANHQQTKTLVEAVKIRERMVQERAEWFRAKWQGYRFVPGQGMNAVVPTSIEDMKVKRDQIEQLMVNEEKEAQKVSEVKREIELARETIKDEKEVEKTAAEWDEKLTFQRDNLGRVEIIAEGDMPNDPLDNRTKLALVGFVGGGAVPLGLLLMIGLLDTRYRYSDEATATDMQGVTLLGILPNLPDRLSDPEQAAIAAHCVHQIRTMLQINGGGDGDRRVFAMTSASPGDGKTSLTLALGLSYAACGTRTLLIDCDLVGAGLSTRMNVHSAEGVLEAIANRSLLDYVRTTDIADVAILPVGSAHGYHASTLSPGALRRLIDEAKKHFDTILIDTGPILGSIEASLVCAAVDGVVLAVSRGQSRPLVEKSLNHLTGIGARLAGVVFNRAQSNDFERSISGMSMRSVAAAGGKSSDQPVSASGDAVGPVARAVAPYARRTDGTDGMDIG
jgi:succinoglycan biosynthesis transport protein ExoP